MGAYLRRLKMGKCHQVHRVANRNMCHHRFVPPPVAYDSWGMLMTSIPHVSAMSFPKPSLSINYGQDEIRVPIRQPFISWLPGTPGTKKHLLLFIIFFFLGPSQNKNKGSKEMNQSEFASQTLRNSE